MNAALSRTAIVAGGGIAGLSAALALGLAGYEVEIFERADRLEAVGAGLQLSPNALEVLARLGVLGALTQVGVAACVVTLRSARTGRALARVPVESAGGRGYLSVHRADLQNVLLEAVARAPSIRLHLGHTLTAIEETPTDVSASFRSSDGRASRISTNILVVADGVHSSGAAILGLSPARPTGLHALRFGVEPRPNDRSADGIEAWLGPRRHAVSYPIRRDGLRNLVVIQKTEDAPTDGLARWDPRLRELIDGSDPIGIWPILEVDDAERMSPRSRTVLVGDAAHAMPPYAAQGAAMAIEDAWVLACQLSSSPPEIALGAFATLRRPRIAKVARRVAFHRFVYHLPPPLSWARNAAMGLRSPASLRRDLGWLYDWTADPLATGRV